MSEIGGGQDKPGDLTGKHDELSGLAEEAMQDKRDMTDDEARSRELWDVPTEPAGVLADQQNEEN